MAPRARALGMLAALLLAGCSAPPAPPAPPASPPGPDPSVPVAADPRFDLALLVGGLDRPVWMSDAGDGSFLIVEQAGRILRLRGGSLQSQPLLDLRGRIAAEGEQGLLGLGLDPAFAENGRAVVHYTDARGDTVVARYTLRDGAFDPASAVTVLTQDQPYANHNGGEALFGPDGKLYIGLGDGGSGNDPHNNGQRTDTLLGKLLRLDVRDDGTAAIPADNPFAAGGGKAEIWDYGLRNPWRFSFDRATGDLWIADVGQGAWEEVNFEPAGQGGKNYGWAVWEGNHRARLGDTASAPTMPVAEYGHGDGACSVTGGYVYRGSAIPGLYGVYLYGDYCSGTIWGLWSEGGAWVNRQLKDTDLRISSFAEDAAGEVYVLDHGGAVHRLVAPTR
ncbi:MAG TPA: PQQ-dependent sugar dehydrogenase [Candidatus Thermoplasmatota archaeon]|jgi:glucose/arabinose dehydrogenase|nr:PQQ-dependent sugar dehydrogenase [Candidatus Thermoplasmatota archaeon]